MKDQNYIRFRGRKLYLIITLVFNLISCSSGLETNRSSKQPSENPTDELPKTPTGELPETPWGESPESTRIICFNLNEDRSKIIGYFGVDTEGETCPKEVVIPDGITRIEDSAFSAKSLTQVYISDSVTSIGENAFSNNLLAFVRLGEEITLIENNAFQANLLMSVVIPESVEEIGQNVFFENPNLKLAYIPNENSSVGY